MMEPKKTVVVTFRITEETKKQIDKFAKDKEWSVSKVVEKICTEFFKEKGEV